MILNVLPCLFLIAVASSSAAVKKSDEEMTAIFKKCLDESGLQESVRDTILTPLSDEGYKMVKCVLENSEIVDSDHKMQKDAITAYTEDFPEEVKNQILSCADGERKVETFEEVEAMRQCVSPTFKKYMYTTVQKNAAT